VPKRKPECDCYLHEKQVCDLCQGVTGQEKDKKEKKDKVLYGYHKTKISKGVLGKSGKIQEELDELRDAEDQGVKILIHCELADLYGALRECAATYGLSMDDLEDMIDLTKNAFEQGHR
jgi:hypothetical protein